MPSPKGRQNRRGGEGGGGEKSRKGKLAAKSQSFHSGMLGGEADDMLRRPRTVPDLLSGGKIISSPEFDARPQKLTKLLLNVTIQRSLGALHVLMSPESKVDDLIAAALRQYSKEGRRPILPSSDAGGFDLHYSQFSLESLSRDETLINLGSRNFFLCPRICDEGETASSSTCSREARKTVKIGLPWLKFMGFLF